jgi:hypothetical protein
VNQVTISFLGPIKRPPGVPATSTRSVDPEATIAALLEGLGYEPRDQSRLRLLVDGKPVGLSDRLGRAEEITIFLPLGGG